MQFRINIHGILLYQQAGSLEIALTLDALNFSKQLAEAMAGYCTDIEVTINEDNSITVEDNGRAFAKS